MAADAARSGHEKFRRSIFSGRWHMPKAAYAKQPSQYASVGRPGEATEQAKEVTRRVRDAEGLDLPDGMAALRIYRVDDPVEFKFRVQAILPGTLPVELVPADTPPYGKPPLDLYENIRDGPNVLYPDEYLQRVYNWSWQRRALGGWLNTLRHKHPQIQLVIKDLAETRIPWELFCLQADPKFGQPFGPLGALLSVTRWLRLEEWPRNRWSELLANPPRTVTGAIAAYIHPGMADDTELLDDFAVEHADDMPDLLRKLNADGKPPLAMVYVAGHGEFSNWPRATTVAQFSVDDAYPYCNGGLRRLADQSTLVFLNACSTGLVGLDPGMYNDGALRGFAEVFLQAGATGVLATTGAVGTEIASQVARDLLAHLSLDRPVPVAEAVRMLRAEAALGFAPDPDLTEISRRTPGEREQTNDRLLRLIYLSMYVYFGSPRMVISVAARDGLEGTGQLAQTGEPP
jgi:CHAT domain